MKTNRKQIYVKTECCTFIEASFGSDMDRWGEIVRHNGDYQKWPFGKRDTMKLVNGGNPAIYGGGEPRRFTRKQARAVASFVEWYK